MDFAETRVTDAVVAARPLLDRAARYSSGASSNSHECS